MLAQLYRRSTLVATIAEHVHSTGVYFWTVPEWLEPDGAYRVCITTTVRERG